VDQKPAAPAVKQELSGRSPRRFDCLEAFRLAEISESTFTSQKETEVTSHLKHTGIGHLMRHINFARPGIAQDRLFGQVHELILIGLQASYLHVPDGPVQIVRHQLLVMNSEKAFVRQDKDAAISV